MPNFIVNIQKLLSAGEPVTSVSVVIMPMNINKAEYHCTASHKTLVYPGLKSIGLARNVNNI